MNRRARRVAAAFDEGGEIAEILAGLLQRGPGDRLLDLLKMKHSEMAESVGIARTEIEDGMLGGLAELRTPPVFRVDLADFDDFLPVSWSNGQIVNLRRRGGGDSIRIIDGIADPGFSV